MKRIFLLYRHQSYRWIKGNDERLLRTAIASSPTSVDTVKLRSKRYNDLVPSCLLIKGKSWKMKLEYAAACYQVVSILTSRFSYVISYI